MNIYVYGPPGSGKSTLGKSLADALDRRFIDLDIEIERLAQKTIPAIFKDEGEGAFRKWELSALETCAKETSLVVALGGGALLAPAARALAGESGLVVCLDASLETILERLNHTGSGRPLLEGDTADRLRRLLADRNDHYAGFPVRLENNHSPLAELTWSAQLLAGAFRIKGMGAAYDVQVDPGGLVRTGAYMRAANLHGPVAIVTDQNVERLHAQTVVASLQAAGYETALFAIPPGEEHKHIHTVIDIWDHLIEAKIERSSTVLALGGGVVGDMAGFAAATFVRGVAWVNVPTTLLAMVDSSLGGKTGIDLPQAKNMVGAFYPPKLVLADPRVLNTLPERELRSGLAEVLKHGVIEDVELFARCAGGLPQVVSDLDWIVRHAMAVKVKVIQEDPYEKGRRQALNLGHTVGHGVETASNFALSHGESIAVGMVVESRMAEEFGLAEAGTTQKIRAALERLGLPVEIPADIPLAAVAAIMQHDKKRLAGKVRFALPERVGSVAVGVVVEDWQQKLVAVETSLE